MSTVVIELPYDRGFPYKLRLRLRVGDEWAAISGDAAMTLHHGYGIPMTNGDALYKGTRAPNLEGAQDAAYSGAIRMSKKAAKLLDSATGVATAEG